MADERETERSPRLPGSCSARRVRTPDCGRLRARCNQTMYREPADAERRDQQHPQRLSREEGGQSELKHDDADTETCGNRGGPNELLTSGRAQNRGAAGVMSGLWGHSGMSGRYCLWAASLGVRSNACRARSGLGPFRVNWQAPSESGGHNGGQAGSSERRPDPRTNIWLISTTSPDNDRAFEQRQRDQRSDGQVSP